MARQASIVDPSFASGGRVTRRKAFPDQMDSVFPWADLVAIVDAKRPKAGRRGRQPWPMEVLLRMLLVQAWFSLSDEATEDAMHGGSCIAATIVAAPSSTKNSKGGRDPEMHQTKKGNQRHLYLIASELGF